MSALYEKTLEDLRESVALAQAALERGEPCTPHERRLIEDTARHLREYDEARRQRVATVDDCCWLDEPCPKHQKR